MTSSKENQQVSIGGAIVFRDNRGKRQFLLVQQKDDGDWEIPKITVRRGESSVRATIRMVTEQGGMSTRILEEVGRSSGMTVVNGKSVPQKFYFYLMIHKGGSAEMIGFDQFKWQEYSDALKKLALKKEKEVLKSAKDFLKEWDKTHNKKQEMLY